VDAGKAELQPKIHDLLNHAVKQMQRFQGKVKAIQNFNLVKEKIEQSQLLSKRLFTNDDLT
jgi:hypothetical protein